FRSASMQPQREAFRKEVLKHESRFVGAVLFILAFRLDIPFFSREPAWPAKNLRVLHVVGQHHDKFSHDAVSRELSAVRRPYEQSTGIGALRTYAGYLEVLPIKYNQRREQ